MRVRPTIMDLLFELERDWLLEELDALAIQLYDEHKALEELNVQLQIATQT